MNPAIHSITTTSDIAIEVNINFLIRLILLIFLCLKAVHYDIRVVLSPEDGRWVGGADVAGNFSDLKFRIESIIPLTHVK
jgi:hypothetical protein